MERAASRLLGVGVLLEKNSLYNEFKTIDLMCAMILDKFKARIEARMSDEP